jgi:hypothetical protein
MNLVSVIFGTVALILALVGLVPLIGWLNWVALPMCVLGLVFGIFARNKTGMQLNLVVFVLAIFRLIMGDGLI